MIINIIFKKIAPLTPGPSPWSATVSSLYLPPPHFLSIQTNRGLNFKVGGNK